jgi:hypothetical protein
MSDLVNSYKELNVLNYSHDDVCELNSWGIDAVQELESLQAQLDTALKGEFWQLMETAPKNAVILGFIMDWVKGYGYVCPIVCGDDKEWHNTSCENFSKVIPALWMVLPFPSTDLIKEAKVKVC